MICFPLVSAYYLWPLVYQIQTFQCVFVCVHQLVTGNSYKVIYNGEKKNSCVAHQGLFLIPSGKVLKVKQLFLQSVSNILSLDVWTPRSLTGVTNSVFRWNISIAISFTGILTRHLGSLIYYAIQVFCTSITEFGLPLRENGKVTVLF